MNTYFHTLDGRIRIKVPEVKRSPLKASQVEQVLRTMDGITDVKANPTTGNILILFDSGSIGQDQILSALRSLGGLKASNNFSLGIEKSFARLFVQQAASAFGKHLAQALFQVAIERLIIALI